MKYRNLLIPMVAQGRRFSVSSRFSRRKVLHNATCRHGQVPDSLCDRPVASILHNVPVGSPGSGILGTRPGEAASGRSPRSPGFLFSPEVVNRRSSPPGLLRRWARRCARVGFARVRSARLRVYTDRKLPTASQGLDHWPREFRGASFFGRRANRPSIAGPGPC